MNYLITVIGPTAIGKTALSIALAKHFNCDIISCDSRQFFKEMSVGTAVPSEEELRAATHHFIQNKSIETPYSVGQFETEAIELLDQLFTKNNIQILVGGSGLYVDAVLKGFDDFPEVAEQIKIEIQTEYETHGIEYLQESLKNLDPKYYDFLTQTNPQTLLNPQRMIRFVSVCKSSGLPYSGFLGNTKNQRNFTTIIIGLEADRDIMYQRINHRVDLMLENGLLSEVENLLPYKNLNALQTVGYRELFDYFENKISLTEATENIKTNTRRFAKRQITWFKRNENTQWFNFETPIYEFINYLNLKINDK